MALNADMISAHEWDIYLSKFQPVKSFPTVAEHSTLSVAVPAPNPKTWRNNARLCRAVLPREWVTKCVALMAECKSAYYAYKSIVLKDEEGLFKFELGRDTMYPKITGDYVQAMNLWYRLCTTFDWLESTIAWIYTINLHVATPGSVFADAADVDRDDVCACIRYANLLDEDEIAVVRFAMKRELEDVCITAAIAAICLDADEMPGSDSVCTFTPQLMAMENDDERVAWLEADGLFEAATDKIVGAVLIKGDHWCALCISLKKRTYTVMDPRNDKTAIGQIDALFKNVFYPKLDQAKRWRRVVSNQYQQMDGVSCGIWVLAFIESYIFQAYDAPADVDYLRYRYLLKVLLA